MSFAKVNPNGLKSDRGKTANVRHLTRIITFLLEVKSSYQTEIGNKLDITNWFTKSALLFLVNYGIVIKWEDNRGKTFYRINPNIRRILNKRKNEK